MSGHKRLFPIHELHHHLIKGEDRWTGWLRLPHHTPRHVLVIRHQGRLIAVRNSCPHHGAAMLHGKLDHENCTLECPSHGWELPLDGHDLAPLPVVEIDGGLAVEISE
ncbi:MAG TPA: Rieske 2Fe-2S domain-containing protein [Candidatus Sulfotelmatobacter sp.]|jgi:nitrite reductase/ring-hydroxylating ferredoxin subunit|nr:Rieske 2Fe-2S domain-containing protein [Candidatus Sulfotelmatobacter sp.]